jgi:electron-transferring-flavoprotein dehydrogenase
MSQRESMAYDVVIVGAGPAGLSAAIRLKQLANAAGRELSVCILEKGSEVGAHILSGAVIDPIALDELIPDWKERGAPLTVPVTENHHWLLSRDKKWEFPHFLMPPFMNNKGTYTLSLGNLCRWLAGQAEELGVEIFPGFPAAEILFNEASPLATWASPAMAATGPITNRGWNSMPAIPSSPRARAVT